MKIAQLFMIVKLPDDFDGTTDDVIAYVNAAPPGRPHPDAPPPNTPHNGNPNRVTELLSEVQKEAWPLFLSSIEAGRTCLISTNRFAQREDGTWFDEPVKFPPSEEGSVPA